MLCLQKNVIFLYGSGKRALWSQNSTILKSSFEPKCLTFDLGEANKQGLSFGDSIDCMVIESP